jgi:hypothetical protein
VSESDCPFCGSDIDLSAVPEPILPTRRLGRAALFTFGATLAAGLAGGACSDEEGEQPEKQYVDGGTGGVTPDSSYGGTGSAIYGCGPFGMKPNGQCNTPDTGLGGASGAAGAAGTGDSSLAGASGATARDASAPDGE